jgi:hypothetical protein
MPSNDHLAEEVLGSVCGEAVEELAGQNKRIIACTAKSSSVRALPVAWLPRTGSNQVGFLVVRATMR